MNQVHMVRNGYKYILAQMYAEKVVVRDNPHSNPEWGDDNLSQTALSKIGKYA